MFACTLCYGLFSPCPPVQFTSEFSLRCYLFRDDIATCICFQNMNHLLSQVFWEENKSLCLFLVKDVLYLCLNSAITFPGISHLACHNDTQGIASLRELQRLPDHNETASLYLGLFGTNRVLLNFVARHEYENQCQQKFRILKLVWKSENRALVCLLSFHRLSRLKS